MTNQHPITVPPELVEEWFANSPIDRGRTFATKAAQWGADQELEACCEWLNGDKTYEQSYPKMLRAARRPNPPSLKEQALHILDTHGDLTRAEADTIRRALEQL